MERQLDWLKAGLAQKPVAEYPWRETEPVDVMQGDIVIVGDMDFSGPNRMIAVLSVDAGRRFFFGALVTTELSLATADALILEPDMTSLPYKIAILPGFTGHLWFVQVDRRVGVLTEEGLEAAISGYAGMEDEFQFTRRGIPLQATRWELRWPDLEAESDTLHELTRDCTVRHEDDEIDPDDDIYNIYIHPALFNDLTSVGITADEYDELRANTQGFSPSCIEYYLDLESLDISVLRAYSGLFAPKGFVNGLIAKRANENQEKWLLRCTKEDGLVNAPFVKIVGNGFSKHERVRYNGRRAEFFYEAVAV